MPARRRCVVARTATETTPGKPTRTYLIPVEPWFCYVGGDNRYVQEILHMVCGCPRCAPQFWCRECVARDPATAQRPWEPLGRPGDGRCQEHTTLLPRLGEYRGASIPYQDPPAAPADSPTAAPDTPLGGHEGGAD